MKHRIYIKISIAVYKAYLSEQLFCFVFLLNTGKKWIHNAKFDDVYYYWHIQIIIIVNVGKIFPQESLLRRQA